MNKKFKPKTLKGKIGLTIGILLFIRLFNLIPTPFVDRVYLAELVGDMKGLELFNAFSGGSLEQLSIMALSITPYITASIILQLLAIAIPSLGEIAKDGEYGRKKWEHIMFYTSIGLAMVQGIGIAIGFGRQGVLSTYSAWSVILVALIWTIGTIIAVLLAKFGITDRGIGNGISLILASNIIAGLPRDFMTVYEMYIKNVDIAHKLTAIVVTAFVLTVFIWLIVHLESAQKKIPVQYASNKNTKTHVTGLNTFIPVKLNMAGVMPIIFASTIYSLPQLLSNFFKESTMLQQLTHFTDSQYWFDVDHIWRTFGFIVYGLLVIAFAYFYTNITFNPTEIASNLKKANGMIPGIRPGKPTADYIAGQMKYLTLIGAICIWFITEIPMFISHITNIYSFSFGGTSLIIVVSVIVETAKTIVTERQTRVYEKVSFLGIKPDNKSALKGVLG